EAIFEQSSDAILTLLPDGSIDAVNHALEEMTGYLRDELIGKPIDVIVPKAGVHNIAKHSRPLSPELFTVPGTYEDVAVARKDGYIQFVDFSVRLVSNGGQSYALALFRDVTEKKRMERELITKHTELRNAYFQLERKNAELQSMQETLVQSGKMAALG